MRNELTSRLLRDVTGLLHEFGVKGTVALDCGQLKLITVTALTDYQASQVQETCLNYLSIVSATSLDVSPFAVDKPQNPFAAALDNMGFDLDPCIELSLTKYLPLV